MTGIGESGNAMDSMGASMGADHGLSEQAEAHGVYIFECRDKSGKLLWRETLDNVVCTQGKNTMLDAALAGSAYTVTGPYVGLISSTSFTAVSAADTMTSHTGWLEAGNANAPTYGSTRPTASWSAASAGSKALATGASYTFTGSGTVQGAFLTYGSGALATVDNTGGSLYSAGTFGTAQPVISGNVVTVSYSTSL